MDYKGAWGHFGGKIFSIVTLEMVSWVYIYVRLSTQYPRKTTDTTSGKAKGQEPTWKSFHQPIRDDLKHIVSFVFLKKIHKCVMILG